MFGTPQPWVSFDTTGHKPGDTYLLGAQSPSPVTAPAPPQADYVASSPA